MSAYEEALAMLGKLPAEQKEIAEGIKGLFQTVNQERGKALTDLTKEKTTTSELQGKNKELQGFQTSYTDFMKALSNAGVEAKDASELAAKLKVKKTDDEATAETRRVMKDLEKRAVDAETKIAMYDMGAKIQPKLDKAMEDWKDGVIRKCVNGVVGKCEIVLVRLLVKKE